MGMLDGKVAFITGAASGIGEGTAKRFAKEGARVAVADRNAGDGERVRGDIERDGGQAMFVECDIADPASVEQALAAAVARWGRLDVVHANAGIAGVWAPIEEMRPDEWARTIQINLTGTFHTLHFAVPHLRAAGGGSVIITSSVSGNRTFAQSGAVAYSTSKAGQVALTRMAALELGRYGIRVNAVCPGAIRTNIGRSPDSQRRATETVPLPAPDEKNAPILHHGRGQPADVADTCLYLASDMSRHVTGVEIYIDGGMSLLR